MRDRPVPSKYDGSSSGGLTPAAAMAQVVGSLAAFTWDSTAAEYVPKPAGEFSISIPKNCTIATRYRFADHRCIRLENLRHRRPQSFNLRGPCALKQVGGMGYLGIQVREGLVLV